MNRQSLREMLGAAIGLLFLFSLVESQAQRSTQNIRPGAVSRGAGAGGAFGGRTGGGVGGQQQYYGPGQVGEAIVTSDPETRRLIVITDDETSQYITQVITNLDRPKPQVLIKVVFLEVTYGKGLDVGVEGGTRQKINNSTALSLSNLFPIPAGPNITKPNSGAFYQITGGDYEATLHAIAQAEKTEVLSRPSILARNNQQAVITVGQEIPFITNTRFDAVGGQINTIQYQDVGIILRVTPFITSDGQVEMIVSPEISQLSATEVPVSFGTGANSVSARAIDKRSADTVVVTPDGQTIIIGGLMENKRTKNDSKIPLLGDIPGLGMLFKRTAYTSTKTELIIFLTPHIVMHPTQLAGMTDAEQRQNELVPKAFTEKEMNQFLDNLPNRATNAPLRQPLPPREQR